MTLDQLYPEGVRGVVFVHDSLLATNADSLAIRHFTGSGHTDIKLADEIARLGLDQSQTQVLVSRVVQAMLAQWANPKAQQFFYGHMWASALLAMRTHSIDTTASALYQKVLIAAVIYEGGHEKSPNGLVYAILPGTTRESTLQDVIKFLLKAGCSEAEIRAAWAEMLQTRRRDNFKTACIVEWWQGLKVGECTLQKEAEPIARQLLLYELKDALVDGCFDWNHPHYTRNGRAPEDFLKVVDFLLFETGYDWHAKNEETQDLVENYFVECLVRGKVGTAFYFLIRYGNHFGLWSEYANAQHNPHEMPNAALERLMRAAIAKAEEVRSYGIAAALAEHLGDTDTADRCRIFARQFSQRVALDFAFYHAVDMHK